MQSVYVSLLSLRYTIIRKELWCSCPVISETFLNPSFDDRLLICEQRAENITCCNIQKDTAPALKLPFVPFLKNRHMIPLYHFFMLFSNYQINTNLFLRHYPLPFIIIQWEHYQHLVLYCSWVFWSPLCSSRNGSAVWKMPYWLKYSLHLSVITLF